MNGGGGLTLSRGTNTEGEKEITHFYADLPFSQTWRLKLQLEGILKILSSFYLSDARIYF